MGERADSGDAGEQLIELCRSQPAEYSTQPAGRVGVEQVGDARQQVTEQVARAMYWTLMNRVRAKPWVHRFVISDSYKGRF